MTATARDLDKCAALEAARALDVEPSRGLAPEEAEARLRRHGPNALESHERSQLRALLAFFWGPIPWMIEAAAVMAALVGDWGDLAVILGLLLFNAVLGFWEEHQASSALAALQGALARRARVLRGGAWSEVDAATLVPGDVVRLRLGDVVPADAKLLDGDYLSVDQSALTGESLPATRRRDDPVWSGSVVKKGEMVAVVIATGGDTFFGRTAALVQGAGATSHFQRAVMRIGDFLIATAAVLALVLLAVELSRGTDWLQLAEFVLILLVASVPVAMPAVLSVTMALGAQLLAREKAIVSRLEAIEEMAGMDVLCSDKTGTLTKNQLTLGEPRPADGCDAEALVLAAALASKAEDGDPIDLAVLGGVADPERLRGIRQEAFVPFDPVAKRTEATLRQDGAPAFRTTKGAPQVVLDLAGVAGQARERAEEEVRALAGRGFRTLGVARADGEGAWRYLGILPLYDPPRDDSAETIARAGDYGIAVKMVTGDNAAIASEIAGRLGLGRHVRPVGEVFGEAPGAVATADVAERIERSDGFAEVFPEHKYAIVKTLQERGHIVGMTGDGVNDAPALKQADVGIAVSGATDAARSAAALVLTEPGLSVIVRGIEEARRIFERMMSYTLYRIAMTVNIMVFIVLATLVYGSFPLSPLMIIFLALLDDVPIMAIAFDRARIPARPVRWDMEQVLVVSSVLGVLAVAESFGLLWLAATRWELDAAHQQTMMFLQLVAGGHLLLFLTRARGAFFRRPWPSPALLLAVVGTQLLAVAMCGFGWLVPALPWPLIGVVWLYNVAWMGVLDALKVAVYRVLETRRRGGTTFLRRVGRSLDLHGPVRRPRRTAAGGPARPG